MDVELLNTAYLCPACQGARFIIGPQGGLARNIKCDTCGVKWWFAPPFTPEVIDNDDTFYTAPAVVLREWVLGKAH